MKINKRRGVSGQVGVDLLRGGVHPFEGDVRTFAQQEIKNAGNKIFKLTK